MFKLNVRESIMRAGTAGAVGYVAHQAWATQDVNKITSTRRLLGAFGLATLIFPDMAGTGTAGKCIRDGGLVALGVYLSQTIAIGESKRRSEGKPAASFVTDFFAVVKDDFNSISK